MVPLLVLFIVWLLVTYVAHSYCVICIILCVICAYSTYVHTYIYRSALLDYCLKQLSSNCYWISIRTFIHTYLQYIHTYMSLLHVRNIDVLVGMYCMYVSMYVRVYVHIEGK